MIVLLGLGLALWVYVITVCIIGILTTDGEGYPANPSGGIEA